MNNYFVIENDVIMDYMGNEEVVDIPNNIVGIATDCFRNNTNLKCIHIPDSVKCIGDFAFYCCNNLEVVNISTTSKLVLIGRNAFSYCSLLKQITLPETLHELGKKAFHYSGIEEITIPSSISILEEATFALCKKLRKITLTNSILEIHENCFYGCLSLEEFILPRFIRDIKQYCFDISNPNFTLIVEHEIFASLFKLKKNMFGNTNKINIICKTYFSDINKHSMVIQEYIFSGFLNNLDLYSDKDKKLWFSKLKLKQRLVTNLMQNSSPDIFDLLLKNNILSTKQAKELLDIYSDDGNTILTLKLLSYVKQRPALEYSKYFETNKISLDDLDKLFIYEIKKGSIRLEKYIGTDEKIELPSYIGKYSIICVKEYCFANTIVTSIILPNTVEYLGKGAFHNCNLEELVIPTAIHVADADKIPVIPKYVVDNFYIINGVLLQYLGTEPNITIPANVKTLTEKCLVNSKIETLYISNTVQNVCHDCLCTIQKIGHVSVPEWFHDVNLEHCFRDHMYNCTIRK